MMSDEDYRKNYDLVMDILGKLDVNHPARLAFADLCQEYVETLNQLPRIAEGHDFTKGERGKFYRAGAAFVMPADESTESGGERDADCL